jgi:hypothetical protein
MGQAAERRTQGFHRNLRAVSAESVNIRLPQGHECIHLLAKIEITLLSVAQSRVFSAPATRKLVRIAVFWRCEHTPRAHLLS